MFNFYGEVFKADVDPLMGLSLHVNEKNNSFQVNTFKQNTTQTYFSEGQDNTTKTYFTDIMVCVLLHSIIHELHKFLFPHFGEFSTNLYSVSAS